MKPFFFLFYLVEENYIPLETQSQANTPVTPSEPEGSKGKGKRHSEGLMTSKRWKPISTQRSRKPQNSASIQGTPTLTTCTGKITIINPAVTSEGKLPKSVDNKFLQGMVKEDREGLSRTRRPGGGHLGNSGGWKEIEGSHTHSAIHIKVQQKPQTRGLEGYGSRSSAPPTPQRPFSMEHGQQEVQPRISLGIICSKLPEDMSQRDRLQGPYGNHQRLESHKTVQTPGGSQVVGQTSSPVASHHSGTSISVAKSHHSSQSQEVCRRRQGYKGKKDLFQPKAGRVRPNDPEAVRLGERSTKESEIVVHTSRISSPIVSNINPTQIEHNVVTPESNLNSDSLSLQMSQYAEQNKKQFAELQASHERMKKLTDSMEKIFKNIPEGHAQLSKASEETNKRLNQVFEEKNHRKKDRDFLDQDINKLFNVYHNMNPQPQVHVVDNPYHQGEIKPDALLVLSL
ncbi:hypothetical protein O181_019365 [Austropuccinia psidii MF-1]|uniref:Uncharacterized protein n=1 Tax=Austropuccinia psidii MF-1 TaxID=1389203 RepID=A0A9Q3GUZ0_9BASI|nr:hypothetical protein [Austropuccinia psidii MF-1]